MNEFALIREFFGRQPITRKDVAVGIGDDAAVLEVPAGMQLVAATDTMVVGVHFPEGTDPAAIGHKVLAVNLSDIAAMGAAPAWFTLNLTLPTVDEPWLRAFSEGLFALARAHRVQLVGGDTTRGPLTATVTVYGFVPPSGALLRSGARAGDRIYVSGTLGDAAVGLLHLEGKIDLPQQFRAQAVSRLNRPTPRVEEGLKLRTLASSCIDVSDGLLADLNHILDASGVGGIVELPRLPVSPAFQAVFAQTGWPPALSSGDDYELCFTLPPENQTAFNRLLHRFPCGFTQIGEILPRRGLRVVDAAGNSQAVAGGGYDHFGAA